MDDCSKIYFDSKGDTIKTFGNQQKENKLKVKKGANKFVWDLVYKGAEKLDGMILWWASLSGPKVIPGKYTVALNVNKESKSETFTILADPRSESTLAQMQQQFQVRPV